MKRGAEKQLSKDDVDEEVEDGEPGQGIKVADQNVLAKRTIRGLPKRSQSGSPAPTPPSVNGSTSANSAPKLPSFGGFGSTTGSSSLLFGASSGAKPASSSPATTSPFSFDSSAPPSSGTSLFGGFGSAPPVASSASNTTKAFASVLSSSSTTTRAGPPGPISIPGSGDSAKYEDTVAVKYFTSLRGLNNSFISAISKAVESDPFIDIAEVLEQYKKHRISVQKEFDDDKASVPQSTTATRGSEMPKLTPSVTSPPAFMPAPPSSFAGFSAPSTASSPASTPGGGFTPKPTTESTSSPFSFGQPSATSTTTKEAAAPPAPPKSGFSFGQAATPAPSTASSPSPPKSAFSFGSTSDSPFAPKPFDTTKKDNTPSSEPTSLFGSSSSAPKAPSSGFTFGSSAPRTGVFFGSSATESKDGTGAKDKDDKAPASLFGVSSTTTTTSTSTMTTGKSLFGESGGFTFGTPEKAKSPFETGAGKTTSAFGAFGSASGPIGFGFGAAKAGEASPPAAKAIGFSFGTPPKSEPAPVSVDAATGSREETPATDVSEDGTGRVLSPGVHDQEGEGEEDEETTHAVRVKVLKLTESKLPEKPRYWADMGVGILRLKKHKETSARRAILRNSSTGKVIINFRIYSGLKPTLGKKNAVTFIGHGEDGSAITYTLRFSKPEEGADLKAALEREVELVKGSE
ncbi:hypothetical protein EVG20_g4732 [Dentipellis fragilis]|uniref:RanBD1 domain-containing protein n=1 Tax=Dentipellis fragilis TaxID=205917 RepID=A0A4Y9YYZ3_9AGAM|nr:hypothetical protein EVG20_g4732 [Dentipellis fragilis]